VSEHTIPDIEPLLKRLSLANTRRTYRELIRRAEGESWTYGQFLQTVASEEIAHRRQTRINAMSVSSLGIVISPRGWDGHFVRHEMIHHRQAEELGLLSGILKPEWLIEGMAYSLAWARLLAKVYEVDPFVCPKCGAEMKVIAIIEDPDELKRILRHLIKIGRSPPGFDPDRLN
jgi:hypothetical protein